MPITVNWYDDEKTIIKVTMTPPGYDWPEYHAGIDRLVEVAKTVDHRVDVIFYDDVGMPKGNPIPHIRQGVSKIVKQANIHLSIIAGTRGSTGFVRAILEALAKAFAKTAPVSTRQGGLLFARNMDQALEYIKKDRAQV